MCGCGKYLLLLFIIFVYLQLKFRWVRDEKNIPKWSLSVYEKNKNIEKGQSVKLKFDNYTILDGKPFSEMNINKTQIIIKDTNYVKLILYLHISGPSLSFHSLHVDGNSYYCQLNMMGKGSIHTTLLDRKMHLDIIDAVYQYDSNELHRSDKTSTITYKAFLSNGFV